MSPFAAWTARRAGFPDAGGESPAGAVELAIELRAFPLGPFVHSYVALREFAAGPDGRSARSRAELHGLATRSGGRPDPSGINTFELGRGSGLHLYRFEGEFLRGRLGQVLISTRDAGFEPDALADLFDRVGAEALERFNAMGLAYRAWRQNSNTAARFVAERLLSEAGGEARLAAGNPLRRPGWGNRLTRPILWSASGHVFSGPHRPLPDTVRSRLMRPAAPSPRPARDGSGGGTGQPGVGLASPRGAPDLSAITGSSEP